MQKLLVLCMLGLATNVISQNNSEKDLVGNFYQKSHNPEGGTNYVFLPDHTFVVTYFGGALKGTWQLNDTVVSMKTGAEPSFVLYGRNLPALKDTVQLRLSVEASNQIKLSLGDFKENEMKPVLNRNANCIGYPLILKQTRPVEIVKACQEENDPYIRKAALKSEVFHFLNSEGHNDLLLVNLSQEYTSPESSVAYLKNGLLYIEDTDEGLQKRPLDEVDPESMQFLESYANNSILPSELSYSNEFFPHDGNPSVEDVQPFFRIEPTNILEERIKVLSGSFFVANCEEN